MLKLTKNATDFVFDLFKNQVDKSMVYHNYQHTLKLLKEANGVNEALELSAEDAAVIKFALLFSDTGYSKSIEEPFAHSVKIADDFFSSTELKQELKDKIKNGIEVLSSHKPKTLLEELILDIYYHHYGKKSFDASSNLLKKQAELIAEKPIDLGDWLEKQIDAFTNHKFYTRYAIENWQSRKQKNLADLIKSHAKIKKTHKKEKVKAFYKEKYKSESPERGIQTMYRTALRNHIKLSDIADTKANILLSVNAIIISLVLANLISKFGEPTNRFLILPTIIFVIFSIASMIMSIKATQPNVTRGEFSDKDVREKNVNLVFFGNFHKMDFARYQTAINDLIKNKEDVYNTLTKDLYFLGSVLDSKYRLLRYTYYVFMAGIILSVIAFALAFLLRDVITL